MFKLLKLLIYVVLIAGFIWFGRSVKLGKHTLFGHVQRIWKAEETQDLVEGARESAGPTVDKFKRGVKAGVEEITRDDGDAGTPDAGR